MLAHHPDLVLHGGDFLPRWAPESNRVPPAAIARLLKPLKGRLGQFAVLGNHDRQAWAQLSLKLREAGITTLEDEQRTVSFEGHEIAIIGIPDARRRRESALQALRNLPPDRPAIVLSHDPYWFKHVPAGPSLTLAGHTHGGQILLPFIGPLTNASYAPRRWTYGHIAESGRQMYVTSGWGTSGIPLRVGTSPEAVILRVAGRTGE